MDLLGGVGFCFVCSVCGTLRVCGGGRGREGDGGGIVMPRGGF